MGGANALMWSKTSTRSSKDGVGWLRLNLEDALNSVGKEEGGGTG